MGSGQSPAGAQFKPGLSMPAETQNALLPRSLFSDGVKPGDTITLKVTGIFPDEVEVSATASYEEPEEMEEPEEEDDEMSERPPMMTADEEIERAAERNSYGSTNATMG